MILHQLAIGAVAIALCVSIHAGFMLAASALPARPVPPQRGLAVRCLVIIAVVLWFFLSICVQCWVWAGLLLWLGALGSFEAALYFATVTFTTLGYGDIVLAEDWRLFGAFAATNGTIIIGWTTAMVFLAVQKVYDGGRR